jgi:hypothetical protein
MSTVEGQKTQVQHLADELQASRHKLSELCKALCDEVVRNQHDWSVKARSDGFSGGTFGALMGTAMRACHGMFLPDELSRALKAAIMKLPYDKEGELQVSRNLNAVTVTVVGSDELVDAVERDIVELCRQGHPFSKGPFTVKHKGFTDEFQ